MINVAATDLHVNDYLLDIIRAGAKIVLPASSSLMATISYPRVLALTKALGVPAPIIAAPAAGPWASVVYREIADTLAASGHQSLDVDIGSAFVDHVRRRWGRALSDYQTLQSLSLQSPWPSWTRQGCVADIALGTTLKAVRLAMPGECVVFATWGSHVTPLPRSAVTGGHVRWTPMAHHSVEALLEMSGNRTTDNNPCRICRLCPMQSASSIRESVSTLGGNVVQALLDFEAETTFPFADRHWLAEMISGRISREQLECHARTQQRSAMRGAAEMLITGARRDQPASQATPVTIREATAIATSRQLVGDALGLHIDYSSPAEVREELNRRRATAPPLKFSSFLAGRNTGLQAETQAG